MRRGVQITTSLHCTPPPHTPHLPAFCPEDFQLIESIHPFPRSRSSADDNGGGGRRKTASGRCNAFLSFRGDGLSQPPCSLDSVGHQLSGSQHAMQFGLWGSSLQVMLQKPADTNNTTSLTLLFKHPQSYNESLP
ncbi:hypothetical protein GJAV_G00231020 [Gymnothorax javanicus]|nr:hypothetical protein GJAV_G00231020 [Gymnothorax javanicus]